MSKPKPPAHLSPAAKRWFREIATDFSITDRAGLLLLAQAADAWDRAGECRAAIARDGTAVTDRFGQPKAHPLLSAERDARSCFLQAMKHLQLDTAAIPAPEPPRRSKPTV
jgi:phage terminase small subunit